jgi:hypothetical protein
MLFTTTSTISITALVSFKIRKSAGSQWISTVILPAQEREIMVQSQPGQIVLQDPISKKHFTEKGWWSALGGMT